MTSLTDFYDILSRHDWHFAMSDDGRVYRRGQESLDRIRKIIAESPHHKALYDAWHEYVFSGKPWNTEKAPKPMRPEPSDDDVEEP